MRTLGQLDLKDKSETKNSSTQSRGENRNSDSPPCKCWEISHWWDKNSTILSETLGLSEKTEGHRVRNTAAAKLEPSTDCLKP